MNTNTLAGIIIGVMFVAILFLVRWVTKPKPAVEPTTSSALAPSAESRLEKRNDH